MSTPWTSAGLRDGVGDLYQALALVVSNRTTNFQVCYWSIGKQKPILKRPFVDSATKSGMDESDCLVDESPFVGFLLTNNILTLSGSTVLGFPANMLQLIASNHGNLDIVAVCRRIDSRPKTLRFRPHYLLLLASSSHQTSSVLDLSWNSMSCLHSGASAGAMMRLYVPASARVLL